jgi:hypothetical protein
MNWFTSITQVIQLIPSILQLIVQIEQVFKPVQAANPGVKLGTTKKQLVLDSLSSVEVNDKVTNAISTFTDKAVKTLNVAGFSTNQPFGT